MFVVPNSKSSSAECTCMCEFLKLLSTVCVDLAHCFYGTCHSTKFMDHCFSDMSEIKKHQCDGTQFKDRKCKPPIFEATPASN